VNNKELSMTTAKFENKILRGIEHRLDWGSEAQFINGTLFITGIMPDDGRDILDQLRELGHRVRMSQSGSYQTDYTFAYDFVA
jgi:hypothetical protein